ncbi:MAG: bacteriophage abortive infection AbiH family protein [Prevotella sp.]|nr:bacteriophage abortive infection AbiH family protein [Prevotella sp.]
MEYKKLYIIGNGFDRHHGMDTRYEDFYNWLCCNGQTPFLLILNDIYGESYNGLWYQFEECLGKYTLNEILAFGWENYYVVEYHDEDGGKCDKCVLQTKNVLETSISDKINELFTQWIQSINTDVKKSSILNMEKDALFLTFNYTDTLECVYEIPSKQILHIHGYAKGHEKIIVGHNNYIEPSSVISNNLYLREEQCQFENIQMMNSLYKDTAQIIKQYEKFFSNLSGISEVVVIGCGFGEVDDPYFVKIKQNIQTGATWRISYYNDSDKVKMKRLIRLIDIDSNNIETFQLK